MPYSNRKTQLLTIGVVCVAIMFASVQSALPTHAASNAAAIVLGDIEYTRDGQAYEEGRGAIQAYLLFVLSRIPHGKGRPQTITEYIRDCRSGDAARETDGSCALPELFIQLQFAERRGEVQISGAVSRKTEPAVLRPYNLDPIRIKLRDLTDGLSRVAKNIDAIIARATTPMERTRVVIACFGLDSESFHVPWPRPRPETHDPAPATSVGSDYVDRLEVLEALMRDQPRISVSTHKDASAECGSLDGLQAIAQTAKAEAVLSGRVFTDDKSGLMVLPQMFIVGASKKIALPLISIPSGADPAASYTLIARKLAAATNALVGSDKGSKLVRAIGDGAELSYYLDRAKEHLSSSPPHYEAVDALLELAISKAPAEQEPYVIFASSLTDRHLYAEAVETLQSGIKQVSEPKRLVKALAETYVRAGDLPEARRIYEEALSARILGEEAWLGIAKTYLAARPPQRSLAMKNALKAAGPQNQSSFDAYSLAGQIAEGANDFETAERYYEEARRLSPGSPEIISRLSSLYERWSNTELWGNHPSIQSAIEHLTKWINISESVRNFYDRAGAYLEFYSSSDERAKGYQLASADYKRARDKARGESVLAQFPWLMPNLIETLIFEGKFKEAKEVAQELFAALGSDASVRPSTDPKEIRLVGAFLNFAAEVLDSGAADKELYLLENSALGMSVGRLPWSFSVMETFLAEEYPKLKSQLDMSERDARTTTVKRLISQIRDMKG